MPKETTVAIEEPAQMNINPIERMMMRDIGGIPVPLIACTVLAVVFGAVVAMTAGGH